MGKGKGGGKGGYKLPGMRGALQTINQLGNQMGNEADADYSVALSASNAGQRGLAAQTRGLRRDLLGSSRAESRKLSSLAKRARAQTGVVQKKTDKVTSQYGSALGQSIAQSFGPAAATAAGTGSVLKSAAKAGKKTTKIGKTVAGIASAGVLAQKQAAKYSLNQALQQRAIIDNQTLAALTGDLYKTALSYNMEMMMFEKEQEAAQKAAKKAAVANTESLTAWLGNKAGDMGSWLREHAEAGWNDELLDDEGKLDVSAVVDAWAEELGINPEVNPNDQGAIAVMTAAVAKMRGGMGAVDAVTAGANEVYAGSPGWEKVSGPLLNGVSRQVNANMERVALQNLQELESGEITYTSDDYKLPPTAAREEVAAAIKQKYGITTAKAWLRGQTDWTEEHLDQYVALLPDDSIANIPGDDVSSGDIINSAWQAARGGSIAPPRIGLS